MKKILLLMTLIFGLSSVVMAQDEALELAKRRGKLNKAMKELIEDDYKPTKETKKLVKKYRKEGWKEVAGGMPMEKQWTRGEMMSIEEMLNDDDTPVTRYIIHSTVAVGGTESQAYKTARMACQQEVAAMIGTKLVAATEQLAGNNQTSAIDATTLDKLVSNSKTLVNQTLNNGLAVVHFYRTLKNNNYEVMVQIAYDKKDVTRSLKRQIAKEMEDDAKELEGIVDEVMKENFNKK